MTRDYSIEDDGESVQLALFEEGVQVGGAYFPKEDLADAFSMAKEVGEDWRGPVHTIH